MDIRPLLSIILNSMTQQRIGVVLKHFCRFMYENIAPTGGSAKTVMNPSIADTKRYSLIGKAIVVVDGHKLEFSFITTLRNS